MKLVCERDVLLEELSVVGRAASTKGTLSILECVLVSADESGLRLMASDLDVFIESDSIPAQVYDTGEIALEGRMFIDIVRRLPHGEMTIETTDSHMATISGGKSEFKILWRSVNEFPMMPQVDREQSPGVVLPVQQMRDMIRQTIFAVSPDSSKPTLTGEQISVKDGVLKLVAVDGFRVAERSCPVDCQTTELSVIIPAKAMNEVARILQSEKDEFFTFYNGPRHALFELNGYTVVSRLLTGEFVNYDTILATEHTSLMLVNREGLLEAVERACLIATDIRKNPVKLSAKRTESGDLLTVSSQTEMGALKDELDLDLDGLEIAISFNPRYLIEALKVVDEEVVGLYLTTPLSPCLIKSPVNKGFVYLILPLRVKN